MPPFAAQLEHWKNPRWSYLLVVLPWLVALVLFTGFALADKAIAAREQTTTGTIIAHDPSNHDSYQYGYVVAGRSFRAWQVPHRDTWQIGTQVVVFYDPRNPEVSSLIDFAERSADDAGPIPLLVLGIVGFVAFIFCRRRRNVQALSSN